MTQPPATASPPAPFGNLPTDTLAEAKAAAFQAVLDGAVRDGAPDAYAAVVTKDGTWSGAAGIGGPDGRAATAEDMFYLASVTQVFTTALILRLAEEGRMDLDAPLASYLGGLEVDTNGATVRQALGMRSGLPDYGAEAADAIGADGTHVWTVEEVVAHFVKPSAAPGNAWIHAGPNFVLLAVAAEQVTGTTFAAALRGEVLDPVGASRILQQGAGVPTPQPWALPTEAHFGAFTRADYGAGDVISCISSVSFSFGSGSMAGDASSVAAWAWHLMAGDVVDTASVQAMLPAAADGHGLGLERLHGLGARQVIGLTGQKTAYGSMLAIVPAEQVVVVFFVNDPGFIFESYVTDLISLGEAG